MATKTYDTDVSVVGRVSQTGTPSGGSDLITKSHLDTELGNKQDASADLTNLVAAWIAASAAGPASLDFHEDTDNGANRIRVIGQGTLAGDFTVTIPGVTGTLYITGGTDVDVADGGTGRSTSGTAYGVLAAGTTATGPHQTIPPGSSGQALVSGGASALAAFASLIFGTHVTGTLAQLNTAVSDADVATIAGTETLTGKTLTDPKVTQSINAQTGTTYTAVLADASKLVRLSNAAAITFTIPPNSSVAFPIGSRIDFMQYGAGQVTVTAGAGVTLRATPGAKTFAQYSMGTVIKLATDEWVVAGDLAA